MAHPDHGRDPYWVMGTRARAEQFAALLDGAPVPGLDPRVASLGGLAGRLCAIPPPPLPARLAAGSAAVLAAARLAHVTSVAAPAKVGVLAGKLAALKAATLPTWAVGAAGFSAAAIAVTGVATVATMPTHSSPAVSRQAGGPAVHATQPAPHAVSTPHSASTPKSAAAPLTVEGANATLASVAHALSATEPDTAALHTLALTWAAQATNGVAMLTAQGTPAALAKATSFVSASKAAITAAAQGLSPKVAASLAPALAALSAVEQKVASLPSAIHALPSVVPSHALPSTLPAVPTVKASSIPVPHVSVPVRLPSAPATHAATTTAPVTLPTTLPALPSTLPSSLPVTIPSTLPTAVPALPTVTVVLPSLPVPLPTAIHLP